MLLSKTINFTIVNVNYSPWYYLVAYTTAPRTRNVHLLLSAVCVKVDVELGFSAIPDLLHLYQLQ